MHCLCEYNVQNASWTSNFLGLVHLRVDLGHPDPGSERQLSVELAGDVDGEVGKVVGLESERPFVCHILHRGQ